MKLFNLFISISFLVSPIRSPESYALHDQNSDSIIVLSDVTVINSTEPQIRKHQTIIITNGLITETGNNSSIIIPVNARVINLKGKYVIPGLIDGHVHLRAFPDAQLEYALKWGITAVRSMGDDAGYIKLLKSEIDNGRMLGPDIYYASMVFGKEFYNSNVSRVMQLHSKEYTLGEEPWMRIIDTTTCFDSYIQQAKDYGVTGIKTYSHISKDQMLEIVDLAHRNDLKVWSHPNLVYTGTYAIAESGVDLITHASCLLMPENWDIKTHGYSFDTVGFYSGRIDSLLLLIKRNEIFLEPTLVIGLQEFNKKNIKTEYITMNIEVLKKALEQGVPIIAGTDLPLPQKASDEPYLFKELEYFVEILGMSPLEALKSATYNNALALGAEKKYGSVDAGKLADMVVLNCDPSVSIRNLAEIYCVVKNGKIIYH